MKRNNYSIYVVLEVYDNDSDTISPCACGHYNAYTHSFPLAKGYIQQVSDLHDDFAILEIPNCKPEKIKDSIKQIYNIDCDNFDVEQELYVSTFAITDQCIISTSHLDQIITEMMNDPFEEVGLSQLSAIYNLKILSKYLIDDKDLMKLVSIIEFYTIRFILLDSIDLYDIPEELRKKYDIEDSDYYDSSLDQNYITYLLRDYYT